MEDTLLIKIKGVTPFSTTSLADYPKGRFEAQHRDYRNYFLGISEEILIDIFQEKV